MGLPLPRLAGHCYLRFLAPTWALAPQGRWGYCSKNPKSNMEQQTSSTGSVKMSPPPRAQCTAELAQVEDMLEQQLELHQALLEGQEGAWEAQALVLKTQKLKEQRRHRGSEGGDA